MNENNQLNQNIPPEVNADHSFDNKKILIAFLVIMILIVFCLIYLIINDNKDSNNSLNQTSSSDLNSSSIILTTLYYDYYEDTQSLVAECVNPVFKDLKSDKYNRIDNNGQLIIPGEDSDYFTIDKKYIGNANAVSFIEISSDGYTIYFVLNSNHELYGLGYFGSNPDDEYDEEVLSKKIEVSGSITGITSILKAGHFEEYLDPMEIIIKIDNQLYEVDYQYELDIEKYVFDYNILNVIGGFDMAAPISIDNKRYLKYYTDFDKNYYDALEFDHDKTNEADVYEYNTNQKIKVKYMISAGDELSDDGLDIFNNDAYIISADNKLYIINKDTDFTKGIKKYATIINYTKIDNVINITLDNNEKLIFISL